MPEMVAPGDTPDRDADVVQGRLHNLANETDVEFVQEIVREFLNEAPSALVQLGQSIQKRDYPTAQRTAHSLKSNCATFGLIRLATALQQLETNCRHQQTLNAHENLESIQAEYPSSTRVLTMVADQLR